MCRYGTCVGCGPDEAGDEAAVEGADPPALSHHGQPGAQDAPVPVLTLHTHTHKRASQPTSVKDPDPHSFRRLDPDPA